MDGDGHYSQRSLAAALQTLLQANAYIGKELHSRYPLKHSVATISQALVAHLFLFFRKMPSSPNEDGTQDLSSSKTASLQF